MKLYQLTHRLGNPLGLLAASWYEGWEGQSSSLDDIVWDTVNDVYYEYINKRDDEEGEWFWDQVSLKLGEHHISAQRVFTEKIVIV